MCDSIPIIYPEGILFASIFHAMVPDYGSICGSIPSFLFNGIKSIHVFSHMHDHLKSRLTSVSIATSTNPTYASYCFDKWPNLSLNNEYTSIVLNRGLAVGPERYNVIGVICKNDYSIFE